MSAGYEFCCGPVLDCCDHAPSLLICPPNIFIRSVIVMLLITAVVMLQGSGVASGASIIGIMAEQIVVALLCGVGADPNIHTTTPVLYKSACHKHTATIRTGIAGISDISVICIYKSNISAMLEGVVTACCSPLSLVTVRTVFILVSR